MKNTKVALIVIAIIVLFIILPLVIDTLEDSGLINSKISKSRYTFNIIASQENEDLEEVIQKLCKNQELQCKILN